MNPEQPPLTFSQVLRDRERLLKENARLKAYKRNARKELKRLARVERALRAYYRSTHTVSEQELAAESALLREELKAAKSRMTHAERVIARLNEEAVVNHGAAAVTIALASDDGANGRAAE